MHRVLFELKGVAHEIRILHYAMRRIFQKGSVPDKIRARFRSRLFLVKSKTSEVAGALREVKDFTAAQLTHTRREMGVVNAAIRECERMLSTPGIGKLPDLPPPPLEDLAWLDHTAGAEVADLPPAGPSVTEVSYAFLDGLEIPGGDEPAPPQITGPVTAGLGHCPVCGDPDPQDTVACPACAVRYHRECWEYFGGCAIYGCAGAVS